ncbi:MAG: hypothetical protein KBA18_08170 [Kiritimatiellae bacterium]|nr:hypothetical protein [Kiritimatiellia bacterium]NLF99747.1 hypothetical protein [Lentisphaerota bacterium]
MTRAACVTRRCFLLAWMAAPLCRWRQGSMRVCRLDPARVRQMATWAG